MKVIENLKELAQRAHNGTSWTPDARGEFFVREYSQDLRELLCDIPFEHHDWVTEKYVKLLSAWWIAKSRCISPMITGFSNFPTERARKFSNWERGHFETFYDWRNSIAQKLQRKANRELWTVEGDINRLENELEILKSNHARMKAANKILYSKILTDEEKYDEIQNLGFQNIPQNVVTDMIVFPDYELTSNLNKIKTREARIAELKKRIEARELVPVETVKDGIRVVENIAENRLQLFFPDIPPENARNILKHHGFRWSPKNNCWQAYLSAKFKIEKVLEAVKNSSNSLNSLNSF